MKQLEISEDRFRQVCTHPCPLSPWVRLKNLLLGWTKVFLVPYRTPARILQKNYSGLALLSLSIMVLEERIYFLLVNPVQESQKMKKQWIKTCCSVTNHFVSLGKLYNPQKSSHDLWLERSRKCVEENQPRVRWFLMFGLYILNWTW